MKKFVKFFGFALLGFIFYLGFTTYPKLDLISGFSAKSIASGHFIDHRSQELIEKGDNDIDLLDYPLDYELVQEGDYYDDGNSTPENILCVLGCFHIDLD